MNWHPFWHAIHVLAAGTWLGGLVFTIAVVSPAFKRMQWTPVERIEVRSAVGRQYSKVARLNLAVLLVAALADWLLAGKTSSALLELGLIALIVVLSEMHARFYVPRLAAAARDGKMEERARLLRLSVGVSMVNLVCSAVVVVFCSLR